MLYDSSILMPLQSLRDEEKAFIYHRISQRTKRRLFFEISRRVPGMGSHAWLILERIMDLAESDFYSLVEDLIHDGVLDSSTNESPAVEAPKTPPPASNASELSILRHFSRVPDAFADTDLLIIAARLGELSKGQSSFSATDLQAELTTPLTNAAATARRLLQKTPPFFNASTENGAVRYQLSKAGHQRVQTLLSTIPPHA